MDPLERSVSHGTDTESVDTVQSLGPALVGNISVDSLDDHSSSPLSQQLAQQSLESIIEPNSQKESRHTPEEHPQVQQQTESKPEEKTLDEEPDQIDEAGTGQKIDDQPELNLSGSEQRDQTAEALKEVEVAEEPKADIQQSDDEDKEREQEHEKDDEHRLFTLDQSSQLSISDVSEVQVQDIEREKEEEPAQQLNKGRGEEEEKAHKKEEKVGSAEQKVDFIEEDLKQEPLVQEQEQRQKQTEEDQQQPQQSSDTSISLIKLHDTSNNELFHHTFKTAANTSQISQQFGDELEEDKNSIMEFAKNYSDDLISNEIHRATSGEPNNGTGGASGGGSADLADFELPPYSGSTGNTSDQAATKHSPAKQRKSSNTMATQASSSSYQAPGSSAPAVATDLSAVKNVLKSTYSRFSHVFQWKRPIESGIIFGIGLTLIIALTFFSIISVVAYSALGVICASGLLRIYKTGMKALNRSTETPVDHLWDKALDLNVSLSPDRLHEIVDTSHANLNASIVYFKQVLLVEDKLATLKFFLFLYSLTYIGAWFNGLTLITLIYIALFSAPILYEKNKTKIDEYANLATKQISSSITMVSDRVGSVLGSKTGGGSKKQN